MQNKRIVTYLLYAIGEIVLVVIGILIAVSIDDWNSENKSQPIFLSGCPEITILSKQ